MVQPLVGLEGELCCGNDDDCFDAPVWLEEEMKGRKKKERRKEGRRKRRKKYNRKRR
jgi:hypothetical protein